MSARPRERGDAHPEPSLRGCDDILFVTDRRFWRRSSGSEQRIANLLVHLRSRDIRTSVAYVGRATRSDRRGIAKFAASAPGLEILSRTIRLSDPRDLFSGGRKAVRRSFVQRIVRTRRPRIAVVELLRLAYTLVPRGESGEPPELWIDTNDVLHRRAERAREAGARAEWEIAEDEEVRRLTPFDAILAIQEAEASLFRRLLPGRVVIEVPHGLEVSPPPIRDVESARPRRLGYLAGRGGANRDALDWFVAEVWPALRDRMGTDVELHVAGQIGRDAHAPSKGIVARGAVESIEEFWPTIDIAINPVRFGSGLKIKNVEALAYARPLVTTTIGAEGLDAASPHGLCIADGYEAWIEILHNWLSDRTTAEKVGLAGRAFAESHFRPQVAYCELDRELDRALATRLEGRRPG